MLGDGLPSILVFYALLGGGGINVASTCSRFGLSEKFVTKCLKKFMEAGFVDDAGPTDQGLAAWEEFGEAMRPFVLLLPLGDDAKLLNRLQRGS